MAPRLDFSHKERMQLIFTLVTGFLVLCLLLLHIATAAHWNELLRIRVTYIIYPAQAMSRLCVIIFIVQLVDRILLLLGFFWIKIRDIKPRLVSDLLNAEYPMVLVQIPMCNEREVYEQSIASVCHIDWPKDRLLIQVLDDSDEETIKLLIREEVSRWSGRGVNIRYHHRSARKGYKAGNLNSAMTCDYANNYEFVAIFDADFQPSPDFLKQTVPHFKGNPELGLVQARWKFVNKDENLITRMQNINMNFHFEVEQQVNGVFLNFFGFNGTAGVWRIKALEDSGGWLDRTTVEDMDIAVRAHLHGWKFIFLNDVEVLCEVPESYEAYRKQQHRWHSGPVNLFRLCLPDVIPSKISIWKKANLILLFFLLRKLILPLYSFTLLCVVLPLTTLIPETKLPAWLIVYVPIFMSFFNVFPSPKSFPLTIPYLLFENTMSVTKFDAMITGLFQLGGSYEWTVTKKSGRPFEETMKYKDLSHTKLHRRASESVVLELGKLKKQEENEVVSLSEVNKSRKLYKKELAIAILLLIAGARSLLSGWWVHFCFLLFQGISFIFVGLGLVGE